MAANFASPTLGGSFSARGSADATRKLWRTTKTAIVAAAKKDLRRSCATVLIGATPRSNPSERTRTAVRISLAEVMRLEDPGVDSQPFWTDTFLYGEL